MAARMLRPLSLLYGMLVECRQWLYARGIFRTHRLPVPVIVVGNLVAGGAGKTPTVIALVQHLLAQGWRPGVVSRGYGRQNSRMVMVRADTPPGDSGDEPALIHRVTGVPVCVAARRVDAARAILEGHPDVDLLVCDDGLQHLALGRDMSIAVFDERGAGNGWLLPAGLLREPWPPAPSAPNRPDIVLRQTREQGAPASLVAVPGIAFFEAKRRLAGYALNPAGARVPLSALKDQPLTAVAGIARPSVFFEMLRARGLSLAAEFAMPDHAGTSAYAALLDRSPGALICTEKDAVKLFPLVRSRLGGDTATAWTVPLELIPDPAFLTFVDERLPAPKASC